MEQDPELGLGPELGVQLGHRQRERVELGRRRRRGKSSTGTVLEPGRQEGEGAQVSISGHHEECFWANCGLAVMAGKVVSTTHAFRIRNKSSSRNDLLLLMTIPVGH